MFPINIYFCRFESCMFIVYWKCTEIVQWVLYLLQKFRWRNLKGEKKRIKSTFSEVFN